MSNSDYLFVDCFVSLSRSISVAASNQKCIDFKSHSDRPKYRNSPRTFNLVKFTKNRHFFHVNTLHFHKLNIKHTRCILFFPLYSLCCFNPSRLTKHVLRFFFSLANHRRLSVYHSLVYVLLSLPKNINHIQSTSWYNCITFHTISKTQNILIYLIISQDVHSPFFSPILASPHFTCPFLNVHTCISNMTKSLNSYECRLIL